MSKRQNFSQVFDCNLCLCEVVCTAAFHKNKHKHAPRLDLQNEVQAVGAAVMDSNPDSAPKGW